MTAEVAQRGPGRLSDEWVTGGHQAREIYWYRNLQRRVFAKIRHHQLVGRVTLKFKDDADIIR